MMVFPFHELGKKTVETYLLAAAGGEAGEVEAVAAANYLKRTDPAVSVTGSGNVAELLELLSKQPRL